MPHIIVKLWSRKSEQQKISLAKEIAKYVTNAKHDRRRLMPL
jgi:phenylpyruvate tautomerase PptA (4-oxalocrotonate tautomerase family)